MNCIFFKNGILYIHILFNIYLSIYINQKNKDNFQYYIIINNNNNNNK